MKTQRQSCLGIISLGFTMLIVWAAPLPNAWAAPRPNIILILSDDMG